MLFMYHSKYKPVLVVILGGAVALGLLFFGIRALSTAEDALVVVDPKLIDRTDGQMVTGTVENRTERSYDDVTVWIDLLDRDDAIIATPAVTTSGLAAGETWEFAIPVTVEGATDLRARVTAP